MRFGGKFAGCPSHAITRPPMVGPIRRERLNCAELSAIALARSSFGTSRGTSACWLGEFSDAARPLAKASKMISGILILWVKPGIAWLKHKIIWAAGWLTIKFGRLAGSAIPPPSRGKADMEPGGQKPTT